MSPDELKSLLENAFSLHRTRIRNDGVGPRLHGQPNKIWPRDSVDHAEESRKILFSLNGFNIDPSARHNIKQVVKYLFDGLGRCNVNNLFNTCCPRAYNNFSQVRFEIYHALDAYTSYNQVLCLIHSVIRSIDGINGHKEPKKSYVTILFGSNANFKIFEKNLKWLVISNVHVIKTNIDSFLSCGDKFMDLDQIQCLDGLEQKIKYKVYIQIIFALLRFIIELLRRYFHITQSNPYYAKLFYFRYDIWQKISHLAHTKLIKDNLLKELTLDPDVIVSLRPLAISKLKYYLKKDDVRLICTSRKDLRHDKKFEAILKHVLQNTAHYRRFSLVYLLEGLRHFKEQQAEGHEIFFVRADIKDCFPSINQHRIWKIVLDHLIREAGDNRRVKLLRLDCKRIRDNKSTTQYCVDLEMFKQTNARINVVHHTDESLSIEEFDLKYLRPCIIEPILRDSKFSKTGFLLQQGLRQGSSFSPILSSIYIQTAFNQELEEFLQSSKCRIYRYVDDILFISTDLDQSKLFMHKMLRGFKDYNLTMNLDKLACNFRCRNLDPRLCCLTDHVIFYRQLICLKTLKCRYYFNHELIQLLYSFRIHPHMNRNNIVKAIKNSKWDYIHLDERLNGIDMVIMNIFERALLLAHRAATMIIFSFLYCSTQDEKLVIDLVKGTVVTLWRAIRRGIETNVIENGLSHQQVKLIVAAAYEATWNLKKIKHRAKESRRLNSFRTRASMRYLVYRPESDDLNSSLTQPLEFDSRIRNLIKDFPNSEFAREVLIPDKNASF